MAPQIETLEVFHRIMQVGLKIAKAWKKHSRNTRRWIIHDDQGLGNSARGEDTWEEKMDTIATDNDC